MRRWGVVSLILICAACAAPPPPRPVERFVLLPHADGTPSSIVISTAQGDTVLSTPYTEVALGSAGPVVSVPGESAVRQSYAATLAALPRRPQTYELLFEINTDRMTRDSQAKFEAALHDIVAFPAAEVIVTGHTDASGTSAYNMALSVRRAEMIKRQLVNAGMRADQIQIVGRGDREPAVQGSAKATEPRNRRVEIKLR